MLVFIAKKWGKEKNKKGGKRRKEGRQWRKGRPGERRQHQEDLIKPGKDTAGPCRGRGRNGCRALELGGASEVISKS